MTSTSSLAHRQSDFHFSITTMKLFALLLTLLSLLSVTNACLRLRATYQLHEHLKVAITDHGVLRCAYQGPMYGGRFKIPCELNHDGWIDYNRDNGRWVAQFTRPLAGQDKKKQSFTFDVWSMPLLEKETQVFRGQLRLWADNYGCSPAPISRSLIKELMNPRNATAIEEGMRR